MKEWLRRDWDVVVVTLVGWAAIVFLMVIFVGTELVPKKGCGER